MKIFGRGAEPVTEPEFLTVDGVTIPIRRNARARRLILKVDPITGPVLVLPPKAKIKDAQALLEHNRVWLDQRLARLPQRKPFVPDMELPFQGIVHRLVHAPTARRGVWIDGATIQVSGQADHFPRRVGAFLKAQAAQHLRPVAFELAAQVGRTPARLTVREVRSRWGSCSARGDLSFNWRLILAPPWILRAVCAHEVAHLVHHNHSPAFWAEVAGLDPQWEEAKRWLKKDGPGLFLYG